MHSLSARCLVVHGVICLPLPAVSSEFLEVQNSIFAVAAVDALDEAAFVTEDEEDEVEVVDDCAVWVPVPVPVAVCVLADPLRSPSSCSG